MLPILKQFGIIITLSFIGEVLHSILPLPVPASIYGIILLFICLRSHLLHVIQIRETIYFLIEIMPILFIPAAVGLMDSWSLIQPKLCPYLLIIVIGLVVVMVVSGLTTQCIIRYQNKSK